MKHHQKGFGLIELMVTILIGMIIMSGLVAIATATFGANTNQMRTAQLNFELRSVVDTLARDLRRAAYNGTQNNPLNTTQSAITPSPTGDSITFSYRENDADAALRTFTYSLGNDNGVGFISLQIDGGAAQRLTDSSRTNISTFTVQPTSTFSVESCDEFRITSPMYLVTVAGNLRQDANTVRRVAEEVRPRNQQVNTAAACGP